MYAVSPLRYPGAKWRLEKFIHSILLRNNLEGCHYAEPFAGGASLAISLLLRNFVSDIHLNDLDRSIFSFWKCVLSNTEEFIEKIECTPVTIDSWLQQKDIQNNKETATEAELGFSTFFLNRTNRSGILTAGVIGGKNQNGKWKIDARYNKKNLIQRITTISREKNRVHLYQKDAIDFILTDGNQLPSKSFIYLDPPYYVKGQDLYLNAYQRSDHLQLANAVLKELNRPWMVSYDNVSEIRDLFAEAKTTEEPYQLPYSASLERKGKEIFFLSPKLITEKELIHTSTRNKRVLDQERKAALTPPKLVKKRPIQHQIQARTLGNGADTW
ncbi:DNA adenine methylase [Pseudomonas chengduensis]|nr:DNA adenine methylase [Pseudomonas chengduensis]MDH1558211.1 DNA adenine methylase [Pseudomonas chengduensis]HBO1815938.1 DNA adenine methylase [Pseudomonas aeruginosa]